MAHPNAVAPSPDTVATTIVHLLPTLIRALVAEMHNAPDTTGMTLPQFRVLARLNQREYRAAELADALEVGRPTLTATVDGLERRGLVERTREVPGDRRGVSLRLTAPGQALYRTLHERAIAGVDGLLAEATPDERAALATGLAALERGLQRAGRSR
jgi:DNA-binding MarR family transcriptional regulator